MIKEIFLFILLSKITLAYIDPGTTGMIIGGSIWPFILIILGAIGGFFGKFLFKPTKKVFRKIWRRLKRKD